MLEIVNVFVWVIGDPLRTTLPTAKIQKWNIAVQLFYTLELIN